MKAVCVGVGEEEGVERGGVGRGTEASVDCGYIQFGTRTRYRGPGSQTRKKQEETQQRGREADRNRNAHGNRLNSDQLGSTADRGRQGAWREGPIGGLAERGALQGQPEDQPDWRRGLWDEANDRESGLGTRGQWQGELGWGVAPGVKPMAGSTAWARPVGAPGWGRSQTRKAVGAGSRDDNLSSPLRDELGHALLVAPEPPPREALRVAPGPRRSASSSCPRWWGRRRGGHLPFAGPLQPPGCRRSPSLRARARRSSGSQVCDLWRPPWARESAQRTTCRGGIRPSSYLSSTGS